MESDVTVEARDRAVGGVYWPMVALHVVFHGAALLALFHFTWPALGVAVLLWWAAGSLGIGIGYHRLLAHRGFTTPKWVEYVLTLLGTLALEGSPIVWVARHRAHHVHTESERDPHSPRHGLWWSHIGWVFARSSLAREAESVARYAPDLTRDRFHAWLTNWHFVTQIALAVLLYALGGWPFMLWGVFVRVVFSWHAAMAVNSAGHVWGYRRFATNDDSRNNWWVALISHGEGWHNNHHAHPAAAKHGIAWYEIDVNWYGIRLLKALGLAKGIRLARRPRGGPTARPAG